MSVDLNMGSSLAARWMISIANSDISGPVGLLLVKIVNSLAVKELPYANPSDSSQKSLPSSRNLKPVHFEVFTRSNSSPLPTDQPQRSIEAITISISTFRIPHIIHPHTRNIPLLDLSNPDNRKYLKVERYAPTQTLTDTPALKPTLLAYFKDHTAYSVSISPRDPQSKPKFSVSRHRNHSSCVANSEARSERTNMQVVFTGMKLKL